LISSKSQTFQIILFVPYSKKELTIEHGFDEIVSNNTKRCLEAMF